MSGAVVTGAARGLGFEIAKVLAARGLTVHLTDVDGDAVETASRLSTQDMLKVDGVDATGSPPTRGGGSTRSTCSTSPYSAASAPA